MGTPVLIFDLGGVLLPFNQERRVTAMVKALGVTSEDLMRFLTSGITEEMDRGGCDLDASAARITAFARRPITPVQAKELWLSVFETPNIALWDFVAELRARTSTYALSDNPTFVEDVFPRSDAFDRVFWSADLGMTKQAPGIFARISQETKTAPADIIFVDDSVANIKAASANGWDGILFSSNDQLFHDLSLRGFQR